MDAKAAYTFHYELGERIYVGTMVHYYGTYIGEASWIGTCLDACREHAHPRLPNSWPSYDRGEAMLHECDMGNWSRQNEGFANKNPRRPD